jgi:hypothetical protein
MSIKRSRDFPRRRTPEHSEASATPKRAERKRSFDRDVASRPAENAVAYGTAYRHAEDDLIEHKVFGRGLVTRVEGDRIEVLFRDGIKKLAHDPSGPNPPKATPSPAEPPVAPASGDSTDSEPSTT